MSRRRYGRHGRGVNSKAVEPRNFVRCECGSAMSASRNAAVSRLSNTDYSSRFLIEQWARELVSSATIGTATVQPPRPARPPF